MSSITHTLLDVNHREWKNPNDIWCVACTLVCLFFVHPGTWLALEYLVFTSIVICFNNSSTHIFVRQCRNSSKNNNKFFCHIGYMHIRSGAPKSSPLGCKTSLPTPSGAHYGPQKRRLSCLRINFRPKQWTPLDQHQTRPADYWRQSDISAVWGNLKESEPENQNFRFLYIVQLSLCHAGIKYHERWVSNMFYAPFIIPFKPCYNLSADWQFLTCFINHYEYIRMPWESERQRKCGRILLSLMVKNHIKG